MGVHGLWQLLQPTGRPVTLESLEGKVLAVDISIWLHHMVKGMRDRYGNPVPNAHLLGLFNRICKLLFYRIKPIFVFDGGVPELKKQTMALRRQRKEEANINSSKAAKKLLALMLKHHAVSTVLGTSHSQSDKQDSQQSVRSLTKQTNPDPFQLRPLSEAERPIESNQENDLWEERMAIRNDVYVELDDLEDIDIESDDFKSLPPEIQHEILTDLKEARKWTCYLKKENLPKATDEFSSYQLHKLIKQNHLTRHIDRVRKQMTMQESGDVAANLTSAQHMAAEIETNRIVSEDSSHYILIKGLRNVEDEDEKRVKDSEQAIQEIFEQTKKESKLRQEAKEKMVSDERNLVSQQESERTENLNEIGNDEKTFTSPSAKYKNEECLDRSQDEKESKVSVGQSTGMSNTETNTMLSEKKLVTIGVGQQSNKVPLSAYRQLPQAEELNLSDADDDDTDDSGDDALANIKNLKTSNEMREINNSVDGDVCLEDKPSCSLRVCVETDSEVLLEKPKVECGKRRASDAEVIIDEKKVPRIEPNTPPNSHLNEETGEMSDEESNFIEISVDPNSIQPDEELFPVSVFTQIKESSSRDRGESQSIVGGLTESWQIPESEDTSSSNSTRDEDVLTIPDDNEFEGMNHSELLELQQVLEQQTSELQSVKQQQERAGTTITDQMYLEAQELLELFGLPYLISPMEAEAQCAFLDTSNQTQGTITDDSDIWLFGGKRVYKNFFNQSKHVEFYQTQDIYMQMLLDRTKMINIAFLCGSDYTDGIQGVGPVTAMEILGEFPGLGLTPLAKFKNWWDSAQKEVKIKQETKVKSKLRQLHVSEGFPNEAVAEAYFNPTIDHSDESFSWGTPDLDLLRDYSRQKFGWTGKKADDVLLPVIRQLNDKKHQHLITSYVISEPHDNKKPKSKRVRRILNRMRTDGILDTAESCSDQVIRSPIPSKMSRVPRKTVTSKKGHKSESSNLGGGWMQAAVTSVSTDGQDMEYPNRPSGSCLKTDYGHKSDLIRSAESETESSDILNKLSRNKVKSGHSQGQSHNVDEQHSCHLSVNENSMRPKVKTDSKPKSCTTQFGKHKGRSRSGKRTRPLAGERRQNTHVSARQESIREVNLSESDSDTD